MKTEPTEHQSEIDLTDLTEWDNIPKSPISKRIDDFKAANPGIKFDVSMDYNNETGWWVTLMEEQNER